MPLQILPRIRRRTISHCLRRFRNNNLAAAVATLRPQVYDVVCCFDHVQVVLDDQHTVAGVDQAVEAFEQAGDVGQGRPFALATSTAFIAQTDSCSGSSRMDRGTS